MREIVITSSALIAALLFLRLLFRRHISARVQYALWGLVLLRLLIPWQLPAADFSVLTAAQTVRDAAERQIVAQAPAQRPVTVLRPAPAPTAPAVIQESGGAQVQTDIQTAAPDKAFEPAKLIRPVWLGGMALMGAYFLFANTRFYLMLRKRRLPYPVEGSVRPVWLVEEGLSSPCLFGGAVYLTPAAVSSEDTLRHVLAHEGAHARHLDPLWSLLRCVCLAVYWFHPLVWAAAVASRSDCELACDEAALARLGEGDRIPYGETLLSLIPVKRGPVNPLLAATTMAAGKKQLRDRISRVARKPRQFITAALAAVALACVLTACAFAGATGQEPSAPAAPAEPSDTLWPTQTSAPAQPAETAPAVAEGRLLTEEEIGQVNSAFQDILYVMTENGQMGEANPVSGFFTSWYADVRELDFGEFIRYFPTPMDDDPVDEAEFQALTRLPGWYWDNAKTMDDMPVPTHRHRRAVIDEALTRFAGITTADLLDTGSELYLPEYDSWYNFTSDFGPGFFFCDGGTVYEDRAVLYGQGLGVTAQLTLALEDGNWHIKSFLPLPPAEADGLDAQPSLDELFDELWDVDFIRALGPEFDLYIPPEDAGELKTLLKSIRWVPVSPEAIPDGSSGADAFTIFPRGNLQYHYDSPRFHFSPWRNLLNVSILGEDGIDLQLNLWFAANGDEVYRIFQSLIDMRESYQNPNSD